MTLDDLFRFKIGDLVTMRHMIPAPRHTNPQRLVILTRIAEECSGGIQVNYTIRPISEIGLSQGFASPMSVLDFELIPYPETQEATR